MKKIAGVLLLALLLPACGDSSGSGGGGAGGSTSSRPNVVLIVADDLGYADLGVHGSPDALTPHIDSIAASGVRCTNGYVSGPYCSPTRAGLLTGRYQQRFGHEFNPGTASNGLPVTEVTLADRLKAAGYATGLVGKWHLGETAIYHPMQRGFDEFYGFLGGARSYYGGTVKRGTANVPLAGYLTESFAVEASDFIERKKAGPFFLMLTFNAVHTPMDTPPAIYMNRFPGVTDPTRKTCLAMLAAMDDAIGVVLAKLKSLSLEQNTLVFFHSDNGGPIDAGTSVNGSINLPLRGGKKSLWEGGIRVPFLAKWPARLPAGRVYHEPVIQLDLFTTALAAAGGSVPTDRVIDGVDLTPFLEGTAATAPHENLTWRFGDPGPAAIRSGPWKLKGGALYNLAADIGETTDVAAANPSVAAAMQADLDAWKAQLVPPLW
jgi:arylsulfatase A-like enzyme